MGLQKVVEHICASSTAFYFLHTIQFLFYTAVKVAALFSIFERNSVSNILGGGSTRNDTTASFTVAGDYNGLPFGLRPMIQKVTSPVVTKV